MACVSTTYHSSAANAESTRSLEVVVVFIAPMMSRASRNLEEKARNLKEDGFVHGNLKRGLK